MGQQLSKWIALPVLLAAMMSACNPGGNSSIAGNSPGKTSPTGQSPVGEVNASGPGDGGGGDTRALDFLSRAQEVSIWLAEGGESETALRAQGFQAIVVAIRDGLDGKSTPILKMTRDAPKDRFGVSKMAVFDRVKRTVRVNIGEWESLTLAKKYELVSLEIAGLLGIDQRYANATIIGERLTSPSSMHSSIVSCNQKGASRSFILLKGAAGIDVVVIDNEGKIVDSLTGLRCEFSMEANELIQCSWPDRKLTYRMDNGEAGLDFFGTESCKDCEGGRVVSQKFNYTGLSNCRFTWNLPK